MTTFVLLAPQNDELVRMPGEKSEEKRRCNKDLKRFTEKKNSNNNNKYKLSLLGFVNVFYGETDISKLNYNKNHTASDMSV